MLTVDEGEFETARWFAFSDVPFERSDPHLRRFIHKLSRRPPQGIASIDVAI